MSTARLIIIALLGVLAFFVILATFLHSAATMPFWFSIIGIALLFVATIIFVAALSELESHFPSWGPDTDTHLN